MFYRVAACGGTEAPPADLDAQVIEKHCAEMKKRYEYITKNYVEKARAFFAPLQPADLVLGGGVVPPALLADLVARGAKVRTVASASDLGGVPRYRPSAAMDEFVRMRAMTCMFPGCDHPATASDIDHTIAWPAGPTHPGNLSPKCRKHHLLKTFYGGPDGWHDRQQPDGTIVWTAPTGHQYDATPTSRRPPDRRT